MARKGGSGTRLGRSGRGDLGGTGVGGAGGRFGGVLRLKGEVDVDVVGAGGITPSAWDGKPPDQLEADWEDEEDTWGGVAAEEESCFGAVPWNSGLSLDSPLS